MTVKQFNEVLNNLTEGTFFIVENSKFKTNNGMYIVETDYRNLKEYSHDERCCEKVKKDGTLKTNCKGLFLSEAVKTITDSEIKITIVSKEELKNKNVKEVQLKIEESEIFEEKKSNLEIIETLENEANEIDDVVLKIQSLFIIKNIKKCAIKNLEELKRSFVRLHNFYYNITSYKDANKMLEYLGNFEKKIIKLNLF